jgi:2-oxoisovalerate dehydrogenase E1 component
MTCSLLPESACAAKEKHLRVLGALWAARLADDKMFKLARQNKGGTFHIFATGHEMIGVVCGLGLEPGRDWGFPYYRDRAFALALGCSLGELFGAFLARDVPHHSGGRMMPDHFSHKGLNIPCQSSCVGSQFLQAVGVAKGLKLSGKNDLVYVSAGDGATSQGDFHEALNFACLHQLNMLFVIQDNGWAISVPVSDQTAGGAITHLARGYAGLSVFDVDGCDYEQVASAVSAAVEKGRRDAGPTLIVAKVPRLGPHSSSDDPSKYKDAALIEEERARDPLPRYEAWLLDRGILTAEEVRSRREQAEACVEEAAAAGERYPFPDPASAATKVFKDACCEEVVASQLRGQEAVVMVDALNHALDEEMQRDSGVVVFGQDVAHGKGGVFGVTRTLTAKHGPERCFNTPLAESTIIALATGMSCVPGFKPVAEVQFADYFWTGVNQLFNELASIHYRSNGEWHCPVVIRMPYGGYIQGGPYHSQTIEAFLAHCPGLKVVIPSNAADAKCLLKAAIRDPNPVVFLEHKALYRQRVYCARPEPLADEVLPLGKARVVRSGDDVTLVCWGMTAFMAVESAETLAQEDVSVEVIDLCTIVPCDMDAILASVRKTGKLLVAHEAVGMCGFGAEIAATVAEKGFQYLDAPVARVTGAPCAVPYCKVLEDAVLPQPQDLIEALRRLARY